MTCLWVQFECQKTVPIPYARIHYFNIICIIKYLNCRCAERMFRCCKNNVKPFD